MLYIYIYIHTYIYVCIYIYIYTFLKDLRSSNQLIHIFTEIISMALARASIFKSHPFPHLNK